MSDPGGYARRVRARPYEPREVTASGVTAWFHGRAAGADLAVLLAAERAAEPPVRACRSPRAGRPRSAD